MQKVVEKVTEGALLGAPDDYYKVIAVVVGMNLQVWFTGMRAGMLRYRTFNKEFMEKEFGAQHKEDIGEDIKAGGFPDDGTGRYAQKLSYK